MGTRLQIEASRPSVLVLETHNIVLAQVGAGLHFNQFKLDDTRILQGMNLADGDVGGLVFRDQIGLVAIGHLSSAADHYPVLGAVVMHLHRELGTRLNRDAFDLVTMAVVDGVVHTPRAVNLTMVDVLVACSVLQLRDDFFHVLHMVLVRNQHGILGFDNHQVFYTDSCDQAAVGVHVGVARILIEHIALEHVALLVFRADFHSADQEPISLQPASSATITASSILSITA